MWSRCHSPLSARYFLGMANLVLYRKYRPGKFSEMVGQEAILKTIKNALAQGRQAHAYILFGSRGLGKTSLARLIAKSVNCLNRKEGEFEACGECQSCKTIAEGRAMDIVEIDAASNRGIDEIRDLREGIKFSPAQLKYKVFIIDEVHMLTREAFNALLKTLEEPPSHALFILATTEIHKVPETIISRCQRFDFAKLSAEKIVARLAGLAEAEGVKVDKKALRLIALNANGGMRDAESLLGQIMAVQDKEITLKEVEELLGVAGEPKIEEFFGALSERNKKEALRLISQVLEEGNDLAQFVKVSINYLRQLMILKADPTLKKIVAPELTEERLKTILEQGEKFKEAEIVALLRLLIQAGNEMKFVPVIQLPLEMAVMEFLA